MPGQSDKPQDREVLSAKISCEAANGWKNFCSANGVSVTAMLEVAGVELASETLPPTVEARKRMVEAAREIDRLRRVRK